MSSDSRDRGAGRFALALAVASSSCATCQRATPITVIYMTAAIASIRFSSVDQPSRKWREPGPSGTAFAPLASGFRLGGWSAIGDVNEFRKSGQSARESSDLRVCSWYQTRNQDSATVGTQPGRWPEPRDGRTTNKSNDSNLRISVRSVFNRRLRSVSFYSSHSSDSWFIPSLSGLKILAACEVKDG